MLIVKRPLAGDGLLAMVQLCIEGCWWRAFSYQHGWVQHWVSLGALSGTVVRQGAPMDKVKSQALKARATYICAVTHDPEVQQLLPQVLLGNKRLFPAAFARHAAELCPRVVVWRENSAWNTHRLMARYLRLLCDRLGAILESRQVLARRVSKKQLSRSHNCASGGLRIEHVSKILKFQFRPKSQLSMAASAHCCNFYSNHAGLE